MNISSSAGEWKRTGDFLIKDGTEYIVEKINTRDKTTTTRVKNQAELEIVATALNRKPNIATGKIHNVSVFRDEGTEIRTVTVTIGNLGKCIFKVKVKEQQKKEQPKEAPKPPVIGKSRSRTDTAPASPKSPNPRALKRQSMPGPVPDDESTE